MARKRKIYRLTYRTISDGIFRERYCLAYNPQHAVQVLHTSLSKEHILCLDYEIVYPIVSIKTYQ